MLSQKKKQHLQYLYYGGGVPAVLTWFVRACLSRLYYREARHIVVKRIPEQSRLDSCEEEKVTDVGCLTLESLEALRAVEEEIPSSATFSLQSIRKYSGQGCVIFLVFCPKKTGSERTVVGYGIDQRGVLPVLGREKAVPFNILFSRFREILPEYRGQRYSDILRMAKEEYCRRKGIQFLGSIVDPENLPAMKSTLGRGGYQMAGTVVRMSLLRGRFVWETPWDKI